MTLLIGHDCVEELHVEGLDLSATAQIVAQFRLERMGPVVLELRTSDGTIEVVPPGVIRFRIPRARTVSLPTSALLFDCVRIDGESAEHLGFEGTATFHRPVTRLAP